MPQKRVPDKASSVQLIRLFSGVLETIEEQMNDFIATAEDKHIFEIGTSVHGGANDLVLLVNYRVAVKYLVFEYDETPNGPANSRLVAEETPGGLVTPVNTGLKLVP